MKWSRSEAQGLSGTHQVWSVVPMHHLGAGAHGQEAGSEHFQRRKTSPPQVRSVGTRPSVFKGGPSRASGRPQGVVPHQMVCRAPGTPGRRGTTDRTAQPTRVPRGRLYRLLHGRSAAGQRTAEGRWGAGRVAAGRTESAGDKSCAGPESGVTADVES
ncbi:TPA: hypothetical protein BOS_5433 [Bos taurus]|nr:TPA: hypothetical protein BOS_5433 [Bos taurus]